MIAEWLTGVGTLALAVVAIFQDSIRGWVYRPKFQASITTRPPDCIAIPVSLQNGTFLADSTYIRLWVQNIGNAPAKNVEVYAKELLYRRADQSWEQVDAFPPMNLRWSNSGIIYFPVIVPDMGEHCDLFHIVDPARRSDPNIGEENPRLNLTNRQTSMAFDLMASPNHKGHIVGPGEYCLKILIAAENTHPFERSISISLRGTWDADETRMLRDGVGVSVS